MFKVTLKDSDEGIRYVNPDDIEAVAPNKDGGCDVYASNDAVYECEETAEVVVARWFTAKKLTQGRYDDQYKEYAVTFACGAGVWKAGMVEKEELTR